MSNILGVSKQGFYQHLKRRPSKREQENARLANLLKIAHLDSLKTYGHRRLHKELEAAGHFVSRGRVLRLMKANKIVPKRKRCFRVTTQSNHTFKVAENKLNRQFTANKPNEKWVSDITYIPTKEGFLYLAVILDIFSRKVVGMKMDSTLKGQLVISAFQQAMMRRNNPSGTLFHSDRGVQYACKKFCSMLQANETKQSMSRKGNCWDNAVAESFFVKAHLAW